MEEKFSVSLELMIQKFKDGAKKAQEVSQNVANKIKDNMSVTPTFNIDTSNIKNVESRMQELNQIIKESKELIQYGIKYPAWASWNTETIQKAEKDLKSANAEIEYINGSLEQMNVNLDKNSKSSNMFSASFNKIQDGMKKSLNSAKRFTLSLFGIQSVYRMLSRASSAYLAQDEETSSKIQSAWIGLGSIFAPLLQTIANFAIKAVSYINVFIKALTGTDFLANAIAKSMNKASKSAGKLSKTLAGFDEITNIGDTSGATASGGIENPFSSLQDVKLNDSIVKWVEELANTIKPVVDWFKDLNLSLEDIGKTFLAVFGSITIGKLVSNIALLIGVTGGTAGIYGIITALALITGYEFVILTERIKEATQATKDFKSAQQTYNDTLIKGLEQSYKWLSDNETRIKEINKKKQEGKTLTEEENKILYLQKQYQDLIKNNQSKIAENTKNGTTLTESQRLKLLEIENKYKDIKKINIDKQMTITAILKEDTKNKSFWETIKSAISRTFSFNSAMGGNIGWYDVGTNYIPNDQLAVVHKGEAIVPKKYNPSLGFGGRNDNSEVINAINNLNETLVNKNMNAYISKDDVGKASVSYINNQTRIKGESVINV